MNQCHGEPVVALGAHRLDGRGAHAPLNREHLVQAAHAQDVEVGAGGVDHGSIADHVIDDDQAPGARELQSPGEIGRIGGLVGIDEDEVEGTGEFR